MLDSGTVVVHRVQQEGIGLHIITILLVVNVAQPDITRTRKSQPVARDVPGVSTWLKLVPHLAKHVEKGNIAEALAAGAHGVQRVGTMIKVVKGLAAKNVRLESILMTSLEIT